jgi:hypothetical protein
VSCRNPACEGGIAAEPNATQDRKISEVCRLNVVCVKGAAVLVGCGGQQAQGEPDYIVGFIGFSLQTLICTSLDQR